jgi:L-lactate dehydrogenase
VSETHGPTNALPDLQVGLQFEFKAGFGGDLQMLLATGSHCGIDSQHIHAHVIGEHGDSEVLTWSLVTVSGMPLESFTRLRGIDLSEGVQQEIDRQVRRAAYTIISGKGATYYGIGSALARIVKVILHDQRAVMTVCLPTPEVAGISNVTLSLPRLVGGAGVLETFPLPLSEEENAQLRKSAQVIRQALDELGITADERIFRGGRM